MSCHTPTAVPCPPPSCSRTSPPAAPRSMTAPSTVQSSRTRSSSSSHSSQRHQPHSCLRSCSATTPHTSVVVAEQPQHEILPRPLPRAKSALPLQHGRGRGGLSYPSKQPQPHTVSMRRSQSSSQAAALRCPPRCGGGKSSSLVHSLWTPLWSCVKPGRAGPPVLEQPDASLGAASTLTSLPTTLEPDAVVSSTPPPPHRVERDEEVEVEEEEEEEEDDLALVCSTSGGRGGSPYVTPCSTTTSTNHASSTGHHPVILHDLRPPGRHAPFQFATSHAPPHYYGMPPQYASVVPQPFVLTNLSSSFDGSDTSGSSSSSSSSAAANRYPPLPIWQPNSNDVLCGRGGGSGNPHLGNARFRQLIASQQDYYHSLTTKKQKLALARLMVDLIRGVGGRFLARGDHPSAIAAGMTSASPYSGGTTGWYDIGMARSIEKTSQAFRETAATKPAKAPNGDGKVNSKLPKTTPASTTRATATTTTNAPSLMDAMALTESSGSSSTEEPSLSTNSSTLSEQDDGEEIPGLDVSASTVTASTSASHSCAMSTFSTTCSEVTTKMHNRNTGSTVAFHNNYTNKPYAKMLSQLRKLPSDLLQLYGPAVKQLMDDPPGPSPRQQQPQHAMAQPFVRPAPPMPTHDFYYRGGGDPHRSRTMTTAPHPMQRNNSTPTPVPPALASPAPLVRPASSLIPNHPSLVPPTSQKPQNQPLGMAYPMPTKNTQRTSPHPLQQEKSPWGFMNKSSSSSKTSRPSATSPKSSIHDSTPSISPTRQQVWKRPRTHGDATADGSATKGEPVANLIPAALSQTDESSNSSDSAYTDDPYDYTYKYSNDFPAAPTFSSLTSASFGPNSNNNNNSHLESKLSLPDRVIRAPSSGSSHSSNSSTSTPTLLPPNRVVGRQPHCRSPSKSPHRTGSSVEYREEDSGAGEMAALSTTEFLQLDKVVE